MSSNSSGPAAESTSQTGNPLLDLWAQYVQQSTAQSRALVDGMQAMADPQRLQQHFLETLADSLDKFMRSPVFLEAMRQNLKVMTDLKRLQDQVIEDTARHIGAPLASDIHGLFERLNGAEQAVLGKLQAIEARLDALESKRRGGGNHQGS
jgi:hypothetical protein